MKDTMLPLRQAVYTALHNQIVYNGETVKVFDEKKISAYQDDIFIVLSTQQESEAPQMTSETWSTDSSIDIEILHKTDYEVSKNAIDAISNEIYRLLITSTFTTGMRQPDHMQILSVRRSRAITQNYSLTDSQTVIGKIITISCIIVQQIP